MNFYLGGFYLIKLREAEFVSLPTKKLHTCSFCINESLLDVWSISWAKPASGDLKEAFKNFSLTGEKVKEIQQWTDVEFAGGNIGWSGVFNDLETAKEYKAGFFDITDTDIKTLAIYFNEEERESFLEEFKPESENESRIGLAENLSKQIAETMEGATIGYDLIGVEWEGDFHTFHCHDLGSELEEKFSIKINQYGLMEDCGNWAELVEYMNDEANGYEPFPWFFVKVKMFDIS